MASKSTLSFVMQAVRSATNRGDKTFESTVTIPDILEFQVVEMVVPAGDVGVPVNFGQIESASGFLVFTSKLIGLRINSPSAPQIPCGSQTVLLDTAVTSLNIDNNLLVDATDQTVEIWLASKLNGVAPGSFGGGSMIADDVALAQPANPGANATAIVFDTTAIGGITLQQRAARLDVREVLVTVETDVACRFFTAWIDPLTPTIFTVYNQDQNDNNPGEAILANTPFSRIVNCIGIDSKIYVTVPAGPAPTVWKVMAKTSPLRSA